MSPRPAWSRIVFTESRFSHAGEASRTGAPAPNFPRRNRTLALICHASVIVEAGEGSGTLSHGWEAIRLGRPLFIARSVVGGSGLDWPEKMLDHGARVLSSSDDVLEMLPSAPPLTTADLAF